MDTWNYNLPGIINKINILKGEKMSEQSKDNRKKIALRGTIITFIICIVVLLFLTSTDNFKMREKLGEAEKVIQSNIHKSEMEVIDCEEEYESSLRKHIEIYIKRRYSKTPKIIAKEISKKIISLSKQYDVPPELLVGMIEVESMFNPFIQSSKGARGLMQVMPEWVPKLGLKDVNDLHEIGIGIEAGIKVYLIHLEEAKGNISKGLFKYVNGDSEYIEKVYSSVGRFVTYRSVITKAENNIKEEKLNDSDSRTTKDNK